MLIPRIDYIVTSGGKNILVPIPSVEVHLFARSAECRFAKVQIFKNTGVVKYRFSKTQVC